jgi:two-component system sensor histidine kinase CpxA
MHSLLLRFFLAFWLIIAIIIGAASISGYYYSERTREVFENFGNSDTLVEASESLRSGGRRGLENWLKALPDNSPVAVYILDESYQDLLGRRVPSPVLDAVRRFGDQPDRTRRSRRDSDNLRPARPLTQLIGPDSAVYTMFVFPRRGATRSWLGEQGLPYFLALAVLVSAVVSYLLARAISNPVRRFREATVEIAAGNLDTRVAQTVGARRDEIGHLARDFDVMTDELQRAWEQQTELMRNVSHELRSPLARLRVALELARRQAGDLPEFVRIESESERLDELIGQILNYSRLEARDGDDPAHIDLTDLVAAVVDDVKYECRSSGIEGITIDLHVDGSPTVNGFAEMLSSATENVLRNAVRHSPAGESVSVRLRIDATDAIIEIQDQGDGVPDDQIEQLFEPFFRSPDAAERSDYRGSGLGLAITRRAVEKNGGSIAASSVTGGGFLVSIRLPLRRGIP